MKHHSIGEIRICHSCENRNPGFPAKLGLDLIGERESSYFLKFPAFAGTASGFPLEFTPYLDTGRE